jgi:predicted helicase
LRSCPSSATPASSQAEDTRDLLSNCAFLGEMIDVPVLDGVAFIDPKRSMMDII